MATPIKELVLLLVLLQVPAFECVQDTNETFTSDSTSHVNVLNDTVPEDYFDDKHESFQNCSKFELNPDEYVLYSNGTAYVEAYNKTYTEPFYALEGDFLIVCMPSADMIDKMTDPSALTTRSFDILTAIGIGVSMVCLLLHLVAFAMVPDLQNLPGCNLASLCFSLFLSYLLMIISRTEEVSKNSIGCISVAAMMQFFFLASFMWMFVMAFDVFRSILQATGSLRTSSTGFKAKKYACNSLITWGTAAAFTAAALIVDNMDGISEPYRPQFEDLCWFKQKQSLLAFFAGPVFTLISLNFLLFGISACNLFTNRMKSSQDSQTSNLKKNYMMYFRLAHIMGITWITGALAALIHAVWLWYLFAALNTFQGFFIFIAFTCTTKVKKHFRIKLLGARRPSEQNLTPTFQSYCYYANSIEKDLDKVVDSKDKNGIIGTAEIHL